MQDDLTLDEQLKPEVRGAASGLTKFFADKRRRVIVAAVAVVFVILGGAAYFVMQGRGPVSDQNNPLTPGTSLTPAAPEEPKDQTSPLTGEMITKAQLDEIKTRRVLAVIVENHVDARPQSGLNQADLIYEVLAEGGITRFVPIYLSKQPEVIGPVRSLRKYFIDFVAGFDRPLVMHIGYAQTNNSETNALGAATNGSVYSLGLAGNFFWRVSDKVAPHNAYTSAKDLWAQASTRGWIGPVNLPTWQFANAVPAEEAGTKKTINITWGAWANNGYQVGWIYDPVSGKYMRSVGGAVHIDAVTSEQLSASNVIVLYTPQVLSSDNDGRLVVTTTGTGTGVLFQNGEAIPITWSKTTSTSLFNFRLENGAEIVYNRGQTWIEVVPTGSAITY